MIKEKFTQVKDILAELEEAVNSQSKEPVKEFHPGIRFIEEPCQSPVALAEAMSFAARRVIKCEFEDINKKKGDFIVYEDEKESAMKIHTGNHVRAMVEYLKAYPLEGEDQIFFELSNRFDPYKTFICCEDVEDK